MSSLLFLQKFMHNPKQVGSVAPSSRFLAQKMVEAVPWKEVGSVAELGSGTGPITKFIASKAKNTAKVFLFEKDAHMRSRLQAEYPEFVCAPDVIEMISIIKRNGVHQLDCIISGLPFFNFSPRYRQRLIHQIVGSLKPGGYFIAFQYSLQMKSVLEEAFDVESIQLVPLNFPPAFVYFCRKRNVPLGQGIIKNGKHPARS
ncbi:class I SAM-dependent methyltransferase [Paenibacillus sp. NPDC058071]|uniref:class I SAM-dependent methyltransferase n=1 Tax=Paenibacillus sp. NPDC058071 TaxID=3346326 RepID=UPI0036D974BF